MRAELLYVILLASLPLPAITRGQGIEQICVPVLTAVLMHPNLLEHGCLTLLTAADTFLRDYCCGCSDPCCVEQDFGHASQAVMLVSPADRLTGALCLTI